MSSFSHSNAKQFLIVLLLALPLSQASGAQPQVAATAPQAPASCTQRITDACARIRSTSSPVLRRYPDGTVLLSPNALASEYTGDNARLLSLRHANRNNFERNLRPLFNLMKTNLISDLESMEPGPIRTRLLAKIRALEFQIHDRERCQRPNRPALVAAYDDSTPPAVLICPLVSHQRPEALITILAYELGHALDLCKDDELRPQVSAPQNLTRPSSELRSYPFYSVFACTANSGDPAARSSNTVNLRPSDIPEEFTGLCARGDESQADHIASRLSQTILQRTRGTSAELRYSDDSPEKTIQYLGFRLHCDDQRDLGNPFLQNRAAEDLLACSGVEGVTTCTTDQISGATTSPVNSLWPLRSSTNAR